MIKDRQIKIESGGVRLDAALLAAFPSSSKAFIKRAIDSGAITVNSRRSAKGMKLRGGESVEIAELLELSDNLVKPTPSTTLNCVFEDSDLLAFYRKCPCGKGPWKITAPCAA